MNEKLDYTEGAKAEDQAILPALEKAPERKNNWVLHPETKPGYNHILPIIGQKMKINLTEAKVNFRKEAVKETPWHRGDVFGSLKVKQACPFMPLAKIREMKSISEPPLIIKLYTFWQNLSTGDSGRRIRFPRENSTPAGINAA